MNTFGNKISDNTINQLLELFSGPEGEKIRQKFSNVNKTTLLKQLENLNLSNINDKTIKDFLNSTDKNKLMDMLSRIDPDDIKR